MATKKSKKAAAKKAAVRKPVPYDLISKMILEGANALTIAKKIGRLNAGEDKTHTLRAIISVMRTKGWTNASGKLQKLKVGRVGKPKTKAVKTAAKKAAKKPTNKPTVPTQPDGKTLSAGAE